MSGCHFVKKRLALSLLSSSSMLYSDSFYLFSQLSSSSILRSMERLQIL